MDDELANIRWVINSKYRIYVLEHLSGGLGYPKQIKDEYDIRYPNISRALRELQERNMVKVVADEHPGKLFALTDYGEEIWKRIEDENLT